MKSRTPLLTEPDVERLLRQTAWARSLAAQLAGPGCEADDLVQEAWVAALQRPPRAESVSGTRAWLRGVLHRLAARETRSRRRRERRELEAGVRPGDGDTGALETIRLQRRIADAVLELEEPYRAAIVGRFVDGVDDAELACRHGVTRAAIRQRVSRELAMLRARLAADRDLGDERWRMAVMVAGGVLMKWKFAAAAVVVAAAMFAWGSSRSGEEVEPASSLGAVVAAAHGGSDATEPDPPVRGIVVTPATEGVEEPPPTETMHATHVTLRGVVRSPDYALAKPPGTVKVEILGRDGEQRKARVAIDADGTFEFKDLPPGRLVRVHARAKGSKPTVVEFDRELDERRAEAIEVVLLGGAVVTGRVLEKGTDRPVPGAEVWSEGAKYEPESVAPTAVADVDGRFRLTGVNPRRYEHELGPIAIIGLCARSPQHVSPRISAYTARWRDDETYEFELRVEPAACAVAGEVFAADGVTQAQGLWVLAIDALRHRHVTTTNRHGVFDLDKLPAGSLDLLIWPGRFESEMQSLRATIELSPGANRPRLVLQRAAGVMRGVVRDQSGNPVVGADVCAQLNFAVSNLQHSVASMRTSTDAGGGYAFEGMPAGAYGLAVAVDSPECAWPGGCDRELGAGESIDGIDFIVGPQMDVAGTATSGGRPASKLKLGLYGATLDEVVAWTRPEADGAFRFRPVLRGVYELRLEYDHRIIARTSVTPEASTGIALRAR